MGGDVGQRAGRKAKHQRTGAAGRHERKADAFRRHRHGDNGHVHHGLQGDHQGDPEPEQMPEAIGTSPNALVALPDSYGENSAKFDSVFYHTLYAFSPHP